MYVSENRMMLIVHYFRLLRWRDENNVAILWRAPFQFNDPHCECISQHIRKYLVFSTSFAFLFLFPNLATNSSCRKIITAKWVECLVIITVAQQSGSPLLHSFHSMPGIWYMYIISNTQHLRTITKLQLYKMPSISHNVVTNEQINDLKNRLLYVKIRFVFNTLRAWSAWQVRVIIFNFELIKRCWCEGCYLFELSKAVGLKSFDNYTGLGG